MSLGFTTREPLRSLEKSLSPSQLEDASIYLSQVFSGLAALTQINSKDLAAAMLALQPETAVSNLEVTNLNSNPESAGISFSSINSRNIDPNFSSQLSDRLLHQPYRATIDKPLTPTETAWAIEVLCYLCQQHQELIRRAVSLLEQMTNEARDPWQVTLLQDYSQQWKEFHAPELVLAGVESSQLKAKILLDLLFYSSPSGRSRLWLRCTQFLA